VYYLASIGPKLGVKTMGDWCLTHNISARIVPLTTRLEKGALTTGALLDSPVLVLFLWKVLNA